MPGRAPYGFSDRRRRVVANLRGSGWRRRVDLATYDEIGIEVPGGPAFDRLPARQWKRWDALLARRRDAALAEAKAAPLAQPAGSAPLSQVWQQWMDAATDRGISAATRAYYARTGTELLAALRAAGLPDPPARGFSLRHVDAYLRYLARRPPPDPADTRRRRWTATLSPASIKIRLENLNAWQHWAHQRGHLPAVLPLPFPRKDVRHARTLTDAQQALWLRDLQRRARNPAVPRPQREAARRREWFLRVAQDTGCRLSELFHAKLAHFDTDAPVPVLRVLSSTAHRVKERREKVVPLTRRVCRLVRALRRARPAHRWLLDNGAGQLCTRAPDSFALGLTRDLRRLGFAGLTKRAHGLRALTARRLHERNAPLDDIARVLGHSSPTVTRDHYLPDAVQRTAYTVGLLESRETWATDGQRPAADAKSSTFPTD